ncbi:hypothetical protein GCM10010992_14490 [Cloacibacterium rupense]|uniref:DUF4349 domain-containing protein n=1 Tax=Cloacibacterium rupense TaxID=517423 RepID=A0ABQ2NI65_9FLAO|nr:DUF4349 domain-containing protein [Cloacibacterium rupense]GGP03985.1 hypothetical protein GCM10010992_14490 [Cloacibacterium rupense]
MNSNLKTAAVFFAVTISVIACKKSEISEYGSPAIVDSAAVASTSDSISMAATQVIEGKKFVKTAQVDMEVKDVYETTIGIEKQLKEMGGFVTKSEMSSSVISEENFPINDADAKLVREFRQINDIAVRVPTVKLGEFLEFVNKSNLFLHTRNISAEDVSANIMMADLEEKRMKKTESNIQTIKNNSEKVNLADNNLFEQNNQKLATYNLSDNLKYSTVNLHLKEPSSRISSIAVTNTKNFDNQYRYNFFYDVKNAIIKGFYLTQEIIVGLFTIWPILLFSGIGFYFWRKRKTVSKNLSLENKE